MYGIEEYSAANTREPIHLIPNLYNYIQPISVAAPLYKYVPKP
jgi:hypothetical protein